MNVNESGIRFYFDARYDMSDYVDLFLVFTKPDRTTMTVGLPDLVLGTSNIVVGRSSLVANQYAYYIFKDGDVTQSGTWSVRLHYLNGTVTLVSSSVKFKVSR